jgi:hypothetical protein
MIARSLRSRTRGPCALFCLLCLGGLVTLTGCGGTAKLFPVEGTVTLDNRPLTSGEVRFWQESAGEKAGQKVEPIGQIGSDGKYTLKTGKGNGAPSGKYKVTVSIPAAAPASGDPIGAPPKAGGEAARLIPPRYESFTDTPLNVEVVAGAAPGAYDLKLTR